MRPAILTLLLAAASVAFAQAPPDRGDLGWMEIRDSHYEADQWRWQYPSWAYRQVADTPVESEYDLSAIMNPFLLNGDFDGDGQLDVAAWVTRRSDPSALGIVVVHRAGGVHYVEAGGPNWEVYPKGEVYQGVGEGPPPTLRGDALLFSKPESSSALWYWDGETYSYYHQGD